MGAVPTECCVLRPRSIPRPSDLVRVPHPSVSRLSDSLCCCSRLSASRRNSRPTPRHHCAFACGATARHPRCDHLSFRNEQFSPDPSASGQKPSQASFWKIRPSKFTRDSLVTPRSTRETIVTSSPPIPSALRRVNPRTLDAFNPPFSILISSITDRRHGYGLTPLFHRPSQCPPNMKCC